MERYGKGKNYDFPRVLLAKMAIRKEYMNDMNWMKQIKFQFTV